MYTDTGFWDTFRAQFPLNALVHRICMADMWQRCSTPMTNVDGYPHGRFPAKEGA